MGEYIKNLFYNQARLIYWISTITGITLISSFVIYGINVGIFSSAATLSAYIESLGLIAPIAFIFIQALSVIIPIIPGSLGCPAGILVFGGLLGFIYSYIGISIGSIIAFYISRRFGIKVVEKLVSPKKLLKYHDFLHKNKRFEKLFSIALFFPFSPDDFLCYFSGLTKMKFKFFISILLTGKLVSTSIYSFGLYYLAVFLHSLY